jgi:polysaccharide deacetylase 2 family uncharacterized protein YibQ
MKRKKGNAFEYFFLAIVGLIAIVGLFLTLSPLQAPKHHNEMVQVPVVPPPKPEPPPITASAPTQGSETPATPAAPAVGDERAQPQPETVVPVQAEQAPPPQTSGEHPKIAIVIDDMGLDLRGSKRAVALPGNITLSFMPYAPRLKEQTMDAREQGHELLLHMPMEPMGHDDPGPGALFVNLSQDEIRERFQSALASFIGFDGVNNHMGSRFTAYPEGMEIVIDELQQRHLFYFDSRTSAASVGARIAQEHNLPTIVRDIFIDDDITVKSIDHQLEQIERVARRKGYAVAIGHPHAFTLDCLEQWIPEAKKRGFVFVPIHDLVYHH